MYPLRLATYHVLGQQAFILETSLEPIGRGVSCDAAQSELLMSGSVSQDERRWCIEEQVCLPVESGLALCRPNRRELTNAGRGTQVQKAALQLALGGRRGTR